MKINSMLLTDGYKVSHHNMMPKNSQMVYSNWTPRKSRKGGIDKVVFFGLQYILMEYFQKHFEENFFSRPIEEVLKEYEDEMKAYFNLDSFDTTHIEALHALGYLPVEVRALPEGSYVPIRTPMMTIHNTHKDFAWVTNYLETLISNLLWMPCTSATIARSYREVFDWWGGMTGSDPNVMAVQGHDFSYRGMPGLEAAMLSGAAHLTSFIGTDTIPAIKFLRNYYFAQGTTGVSVPATEHSVMCMHGKDNELDLFRKLIFETYPEGIISIVSDTWNLWKVFDYLQILREPIKARPGKVVIRPDSSWTTPEDIICGLTSHPKLEELDPKYRQRAIRGVIENLWDIFGGTVNKNGYKVLDPCIGAIYGEAIQPEGADNICARLANKGFASSNIIFGVGSFSYQYNTRDTFGFAMKATAGRVDGKDIQIFKDPVTDSGEKTSAKGFLRVTKGRDGKIKHEDGVSFKEAEKGLLEPVFKDGVILKYYTLDEVRENVQKETLLNQRLVLTN